MKKRIHWKPGTMLYPLPAVMVSCGTATEEYNIITIAWTGIVNSNPPMCYISIRPERHSHAIIKKNREFVINLTTARLAHATDWCGVRSGRDYDKFKEMQLTPGKGQILKTPLIEESPLNLECKVKDIISLGSHDMFMGEIIAVSADSAYMDDETNQYNLAASGLMTFIHGRYYKVAGKLGKFGFSVKGTKRQSKK